MRNIQTKPSGGEDIYWNKGAHELRIGSSVQGFQSYVLSAPAVGTWTFTNTNAFLQDQPTNFSGVCLPALYTSCATAGFSTAAVSPHDFIQYDYGFYIQDGWKVPSTLTMNLGLRYEPQWNPYDAYGTLSFSPN